MVTRNTEAAMDLLEESRAKLIADARRIAAMLIRKCGYTHSRDVRHEMHRIGLLDGYDGADYWLGCVFRSPEFVFTGDWYTYSDPYRNVHERRVRVWALAGEESKKRPAKKKRGRPAKRVDTRQTSLPLPLPALKKTPGTKRAKVNERQLGLPGV